MSRALVASTALASIVLIGLGRHTKPSDIKREIVSRSGLDPELIHDDCTPEGEAVLVIEDEDLELVRDSVEEALLDLEIHRELYSHRWC